MKNFNTDILPPDPEIAKAVTAGLFWHPNLQPGMDRNFPTPVYLHLPRTPGLPVLERDSARLPFTSVRILSNRRGNVHDIAFSYPELSRHDSNSSLMLRVYDEVTREKSQGAPLHGGSLCVNECILPEGLVIKDTSPTQITFAPGSVSEANINGYREHGLSTVTIGQAVLNTVSNFRSTYVPSVGHR